MTNQGVMVTLKEANDLHQLLLADQTFFWEGGGNGCFARAVVAADRLEREGVPTGAIGKILVIHKHAPRRGWSIQTRLGGTQLWTQHVASTLQTDAGPHVLDPTLCLAAENESAWLSCYPAEPLNPATVPPTASFIQTVLRSSDTAFRQFLVVAANRPDFLKHLLSDPGIAARLDQLGDPVRLWLERNGPIAELFDPHLSMLPKQCEQLGPLVRGEVVRVAHGVDFFTNVFWDTAGTYGSLGLQDALAELSRLRRKVKP